MPEAAFYLAAAEKKVAGFQKRKHPQTWVLFFFERTIPLCAVNALTSTFGGGITYDLKVEEVKLSSR